MDPTPGLQVRGPFRLCWDDRPKNSVLELEGNVQGGPIFPQPAVSLDSNHILAPGPVPGHLAFVYFSLQGIHWPWPI